MWVKRSKSIIEKALVDAPVAHLSVVEFLYVVSESASNNYEEVAHSNLPGG